MALDLDDLDPRQKKAQPRNLDAMNIEDLQEYAAALQAELARVAAKIEKQTMGSGQGGREESCGGRRRAASRRQT